MVVSPEQLLEDPCWKRKGVGTVKTTAETKGIPQKMWISMMQQKFVLARLVIFLFIVDLFGYLLSSLFHTKKMFVNYN